MAEFLFSIVVCIPVERQYVNAAPNCNTKSLFCTSSVPGAPATSPLSHLGNWNRVRKTGLSHDVNTSLYTDRMPINTCHVIVVTLIYGCSLSATTVIGGKNRRRRYAIGATGSSLQY